MGLASFAQMLVLTAAITDAGPQPLPTPPELPKPIFTRQTLFSIPFQIDTSGDPAQQPAAIQLLVSSDRGVTWQTFASVEPARSQFLFRAAGDGEYWFQVRTLDRSGKTRPGPSDRPGLRVVVDTTPPQLDLAARRGNAGQITATWQLGESHLDPDSFTIQYRLHPDQPWQTVAIDRQTMVSPGPTHGGEVTWLPDAGGDRLEIRAEAADTAGNRDVTHTQIALASGQTGVVGSSSVAEPPDAGPPGAEPPDAGPAVSAALDSETGSWHPSIAAASHPAIRDQFQPASSPATADSSDGVRPPPRRPQRMNTRQFELGYEIDLAGSSETVQRVELWGTRDGGQTWSYFGLDDDNRSPVLARVDGEGLWGFRVAIGDHRGHGGGSPQPGDQPDVLVWVDLTNPAARILSAERAATDPTGPWIIRWEAADAALGDRPISLYYRAAPGGPWLRIAKDLDNRGQFEWSHDLPASPPVSFRLEVRDAAGNMGVFQTPETPVPSGQGPSARIHDVRPPRQPRRGDSQ